MTNEEIREKILTEAMAELKANAGEVIGSIMGQLYADYLPHVASDTESNISYRVEGCIRNMIAGTYEKADVGDDLVWINDGYGNNHLINLASYNLTLKPLCDLMGETIQSNRIKQLEDKVQCLENQLRERYSR
jgi:hypothetical protein